MKYILLVCFSIITFSVFSQEKKIIVAFVKDGKEQKITDNFNVFFVTRNPNDITITCPKITDSTFVMPMFNENQKGIIIFHYGNQWIGFEEESLRVTQNMKFTFGFDKKPVDYTEIKEEKGIKYYVYVQYSPYERGVDTFHWIGLKDLKEYRKNIKKFLCNE